MPSITDGVPGLEAIWTLTPGSPWPSFTMNDWMSPSTGLTQIPHTRLQKIVGLNSKADADDPRVALNYQTGEFPFPRIPRGKTLTYTGIVVGSTLSQMRSKLAALEACTESGLAALSQPLGGWAMVVAYDPTYDPTGMTFVGYGRPVGFTADDEQLAPMLSPSGYQRGFTLSYRMSDPRWFVTSDVQSVGYGGTGGAWSGIASGTSGVLTMPGLRPSEPIFEIHGSGTGSAVFTITVTETGLTLHFTLPAALAIGDVLIVDYTSRLITYQPLAGGSLDYTGFLTNLTGLLFAWGETAGGSLQVGTSTITVIGDTWAVKSTPAV